MNLRSPILLLLFPVAAVSAERMERAEQPDEVGLVTVSRSYLPGEGEACQPPNHGFENRLQGGNGWTLWGWDVVTDKSAPEGNHYLQSRPGEKLRLVLDRIPVEGQHPIVISLWLKTAEDGLRALFSAQTEAVRFGAHTNLILPRTHGEWRRVGFYLRPPPGVTSGRFMLNFESGPDLSLDDLRVRSVTETEFATAWNGWRARYPPRDLTPRPDDGRHLAPFLRKVRETPYDNAPLRIMGIGSSYTNMLGNGERLIQHLRGLGATRPIHYTRHVGSSVNYDFTRGWMQQHVLEQGPDLVILYSGGDAADLDALLTEFRARSTADLIVASLHLRELDQAIAPSTIDNPPWDAVREVCARHGVEFVENRREWAAYLTEHGQAIPWLLKDAVHQNDHGALVINENIIRHISENRSPASAPDDRERLLLAEHPRSSREGESLETTGDGYRLRFHGNRIDLLGKRVPHGGVMDVFIDGMPASRFPAFHQTLIVPGPDNHKPGRGLAADRAPHLVHLGQNLVPQDWTIRMTSDAGDYELTGSVTGPEGTGHNGADFTGASGQITIPTALWRRRLEKDGSHANRTGDRFTFRVYRATTPQVDFGGEGRFRAPLLQNAGNTWHEIRLVPRQPDDHEFPLHGFHIYEPPPPLGAAVRVDETANRHATVP